jgi:GMP synthase-like glutamine amidotransferase
MRFCSLEHEPFENVGLIADWIASRGHQHSIVRLYHNEALPPLDSFDAYIIMGGGMSVHDEHQFPWLVDEKAFLKNAILANIGLLGICLGAQLLSVVLGGSVTKNPEKEIGWFDIDSTTTPSHLLPNHKLTVFQWHGETFTLPANTIHTFSSRVCKNQAFESNDGKWVGFQFHIETGADNIRKLIDGAPQDLKEKGPFIQSIDTMIEKTPRMSEQFDLLCGFMDNWAEAVRT